MKTFWRKSSSGMSANSLTSTAPQWLHAHTIQVGIALPPLCRRQVLTCLVQRFTVELLSSLADALPPPARQDRIDMDEGTAPD